METQEFNRISFCPQCKRFTPYAVKAKTVTYHQNGVQFEYAEQSAYCVICKKEVYVGCINDENAAAREIAYQMAVEKK